MKKILIVNGPNLNLLGKREPHIYGNESFEDHLNALIMQFKNLEISYFQSNVEGELINALQNADVNGIVLNAGGYTHTSVALADCIAAISTPVVEVHISNVFKREKERHISLISAACVGSISGFGLKSYDLALMYFETLEV